MRHAGRTQVASPATRSNVSSPISATAAPSRMSTDSSTLWLCSGSPVPTCELGLPGRDVVGLAVPLADVGDGDDAVAAVEGLDLVGADEQVGGGGAWLIVVSCRGAVGQKP